MLPSLTLGSGMAVPRVQTVRVALMASLWVVSAAFMVLGTIHADWSSGPTQRACFSWGIFFAIGAGSVSVWAVVSWYATRERLRMEDLASIMAYEAARHQDHRSRGTVVTLR